jgi:gliding motility-associated protein GldM
MSGGKQTPRQKMIGMMYLVLTALLALNISKEIINAFITIDTGLKKTNSNFDGKNAVTYGAFELAKLNDEKKAGPLYAKAMAVKSYSESLCRYINSLRGEMIAHSAGGDITPAIGDTLHLDLLEKPDDYDTPTHFMIGEDPANVTGKAKDLKDSLLKYHDKLVALLPAKSQEKLKGSLDPLVPTEQYSQENEKMISWEWYNFYHAPIVAAIAQLTRIQNDVKNAEGDVVNELYKSISAADFKFDTLAAKVVAPTSYVLTGEEYTASIFVAAFSTTSNPQVWLGEVDSTTNTIKGPIDSTTVKVNRGVGTYTVQTGATGAIQWSGLIRVKRPDNSWDAYPFKSEYIVAAPAAAVFLEKMNVFYIGVDNPITISAAGASASDLSPSLAGGSISAAGGKPGHYIVRVTGGTKATLNVSAKLNGVSKSMGTFEFRVKRVPDPVAYVGAIKGDGVMTKAELNNQSGVFARMEGFDFDLSFRVVSFIMSMSVNGVFVEKKANGPGITPEMKSLFAGARPGNKVFFEQITVQGPDGSLRKIPGVNIKIR